MAERANLTLRACPGPIGSGRTKSWVSGWCCHGDRETLVEGRVTVGLQCVFCGCVLHGVSVLWLCFGVEQLFSYRTCKKVKFGPAKMANFSALIKKMHH